ncbi:hypothetical protein DKX38_029233 [Salix brachista]|uniref:Uncharacterized protein n=1 Tax=Salix brachista TaxID=2182728 RepID=A0A5N5J2Z0_9ROSI|nr:hypothetical protein DKX38_029202 [Salix brachista]KAB5512205.1 hypothetical protein DKX38_029233 [Salix brachista]
MEMQSQQRLFSVKRQAPQRRQLSTVGGRGRGRGCGVEYRVLEGHTPNKTQKIILDNLWYSVKQKDLAHFKAAMEALSSYFMQEASSSSATCQNCKTYRGQIAEVIDQIDNKDDKIQSLHERIMELEAQVDTLKSAPQAMQPQQQQRQQNLMQQQKPLLQVQEEVDRSKQIEISVLKIEQQTMKLLQRVKFLPYMQDQVLRQYLHRRYDLSDLKLKSMRTILELPDDDLPPRNKDQDEEEKDEAQDEVRPIFSQGNFNLSKEDSPLHNNSRRPLHRSQLPPKRTGSPKFVQDKRKKLEDKAPATAM